MKKNTYCYWLMASAAAGNRMTAEECKMLNEFLSNSNTRSR